MFALEVEESKCPQNHYCPVIRLCPAGAITQENPYSAPVIDYSKCTSCSRCAKMCGFGAFQYKRI